MAETPNTVASNPPSTSGEEAGYTRHAPELLAPAGDWECARAAVENGADAIYFGLEKFNARMRADNFTQADLPKLMEFLHRRGVKGYITFNTLVFSNELPDAEDYLRTIIAAGVDAIILQDVGMARLIRMISPDVPIHASTQMTISSLAGVDFAKEIGCSLVILARECSLKEIAEIAHPAAGSSGGGSLPIEVFVHGALCVAYSGQCLTSEALGGRSANRGECAQACRMPYDLLCDGNPVALGDRKYLLSPQDLAGLEVLPDLVKAGVASLKIEGRLKSPEYVANITRIYRNALDAIAWKFNLPKPMQRPVQPSATDARYEMEMAFSRGLFTGWFRGTNHQALVHGRFGKKRGVYLGKVIAVGRGGVTVKLESPLKAGDGLVFDCGKPEENEQGGRVYSVTSGSSGSLLQFGRDDVDLSRVHIGDKVWKTDDPELNRRLRQTFSGDKPQFQRPITVEVHGTEGKPLTAMFRDGSGRVAQTSSAMPLVRASNQPLTSDRLREQMGRLGGTPFCLGDLKNFLEGDVILPMSELNRLRREAVAELERKRALPTRWTIRQSGTSASSSPLISRKTETPVAQDPRPALSVLVRSMEQFEAAMNCEVRTLYCDFEDPKKYREAVGRFRARESGAAGRELFVAPPRVYKLGEEWALDQVRSSNADGYLVRNYDHLRFFEGCRRVGDYSLNIANQISAEYFKTRFALERITASYDLNIVQLDALLKAAPAEWFEVTVHQHMPMFHMEHCLFCAFLTTGTDYRNCGRPCDRVDLKLRDRVGIEHPVKADAGCRNTVFNGRAQTGAESVSHLLSLGVRRFRIEFVNESAAEVKRTVWQYHQLLRGEISGAQLWRELKLLNQLGVTRGQLEQR